MMTTLDLTTATPAEIDSAWEKALAPIHVKEDKALALMNQSMAKYKLAAHLRETGRDERGAEERKEAAATLAIEAQRLNKEAHAERIRVEFPFKAEWVARGGWTRAYKVTNSNGHIHSTTICMTCFSTTPFAWITELSGCTDDEIAELAGEAACTICYPNAPVSKPCQIFTKDEQTKQAAKVEREAKREAKAAKAAANAIVEYDENCKPTGQPIYDSLGFVIKTITAAKQALNSQVFWMLSHQKSLDDAAFSDEDGLIDHETRSRDRCKTRALFLAHCIACATGNTMNSDELFAKAQKKAQREIAKAQSIVQDAQGEV